MAYKLFEELKALKTKITNAELRTRVNGGRFDCQQAETALKAEYEKKFKDFSEAVTKDNIAFAELVLGLKLQKYQKELIKKMEDLPDKARRMVLIQGGRVRRGTHAYSDAVIKALQGDK